jgi:hypothetical protein
MVRKKSHRKTIDRIQNSLLEWQLSFRDRPRPWEWVQNGKNNNLFYLNALICKGLTF